MTLPSEEEEKQMGTFYQDAQALLDKVGLGLQLDQVMSLDFDDVFRDAKRKASKDAELAPVALFAMWQVADVIRVAFGAALKAGEIAVADQLEAQGKQLLLETIAVFKDFADQARRPLDKEEGESYSFQSEKQNVRILLKKWNANSTVQQLWGISPGTPEEFPEDFKKQFLGENSEPASPAE